MKKLVAGLAIVSLITIGAIAYAHGPGFWGGGHMMGPSYSGGHMMGPGSTGYGYDQKFFDETADLRKELHDKKFEYFETLRNPETTTETIATLEKEIRELQEKLYEKASRTAYGRFGGYGCW